MRSNLEVLVYPDPPFGGRFAVTPGLRLADALASRNDGEIRNRLDRKLWQACRKLAMAWYGGDEVLRVEADFYSATFQDSPSLFGEDAICLHYHLNAFVLLARSAMDIASGTFAELMPPPFVRKRCDSFNDLVKRIQAEAPNSEAGRYLSAMKDDPASWLGVLTSLGERRGLRDKLAHQMEFPLGYREVWSGSEKERPLVFLTDDITVRLEQFIDDVRVGVVSGFLKLEDECLGSVEDAT